MINSTCSFRSDLKKAVGRSLSEAQSEDFAGRLNKRFDAAEAIEEHESGSAVSQESLVEKRQPQSRRFKEPTSGTTKIDVVG